MSNIVILLVTLCVTACGTVPPARQFNSDGNRALEAGQYQAAREKYKKGLEEAEKSHDQQYTAIAMYGLARSNGYLCNFKEAEQWFAKSIALREQIPDTQGIWLSQNLLEFSRLYVAQKKYKEATVQFARAVPMLDRLNMQTRDPIGYADVLADYEKSLRAIGNTKQAAQVQDRIKNLRSSCPSCRAGFQIRPYPDKCP